MSRSKKQRSITVPLVSSMILALFLMPLNVKCQVNKFLDIPQSFDMLERSTIQNEHLNAQNFDISLPSSLWTVNSINLNFSRIQFAPKNQTYEDKFYQDNYYEIYWQNNIIKRYMVAVQFNLDTPSTIFGAFLYSRKSQNTTETISVQIRGSDPVSETPNSTLYANSDFSVSSTPNWYFQDFSSPVELPKGNYFFILNGLIVIGNKTENFFWYSNNNDPINPSIKVLEYVNSWIPGTQGIPLFKLLKKVNVPIYPEEIFMKVEINEVNHTIFNGVSEGQGFLELSNVDFYPNSDFLNFIVSNNVSSTLIFNATSTLEIKKLLNAPTTLRITENQPNRWTLMPTILKTSDNCSVRFNYPINWEKIVLYRDDVDITSQVIVDEVNKYIFIPNEIITHDSDWEIKAESPRFNFSLNVPKTEFEIGKELLFALSGTPQEGNYTFILYDIADVALEPIVKQIPPDDGRFSFSIPEDFYEGDYRAVIFWNNLTDGGVTSQIFTFISYPYIPPPDLGPLILTLLIVGISVAVAAAFYIIYKKFKNIREYTLEKILTQCVDVSNINLIIVMDKNSGIDLFSRSFSGKKVEPTLISGFLQAISKFGAEISEEAQESRTLKLEYKDSILLMNEFVNFRIIISMKENPSRNFLFLIDDLAFDIYKNYGEKIDNFRGNLNKFQGIDRLVEKHLGVSFILPLKVVLPKDQKLSLSERQMVEKASDLLKSLNTKTFYSLHLLPENECSPKDYKTIVNLIQKGVFQPQGI